MPLKFNPFRKMPEIIIVTRHKALVQWLREKCPGLKNAPALEHVGMEDVRDKVVVGVLPFHLAAAARLVIEVPLNLRPEDRGRELSVEEMRDRVAGKARAYTVEPQGLKFRRPRLGREVRWWLKQQMGVNGWVEA